MPPQLGDPRRPCVGGDHQAVGRDRARVGVNDGGEGSSESPHQRVLVHAHARGQASPSQPAGEDGRLDGGAALVKRPAQMSGRPCAAGDLVGGQLHERVGIHLCAALDGALPRAHPGGRAARPQPSPAHDLRCRSAARGRSASISSIARSDSRQIASATSALTSFRSDGNLAHHDSTKPPFRPEAPPPQMSRSSTTTSVSGAACLIHQAVHSPTKPPPMMHTSAVVDSPNGAASGASPSACSSQSERCGAGVVGENPDIGGGFYLIGTRLASGTRRGSVAGSVVVVADDLAGLTSRGAAFGRGCTFTASVCIRRSPIATPVVPPSMIVPRSD